MLLKIHPDNFTWQLWRAGTLFDLGVLHYRYEFIVAKRIILRKFAIGYCRGASLLCRPKIDCYGVMFQRDNICFWTHLTTKELNYVFGDK